MSAMVEVAATIDDEGSINLWACQMIERGVRPSTRTMRLEVVRQFARHIGRPLVTATRADVVAFTTRTSLSQATQYRYRSTLRLFNDALRDAGYRADNPAARQPRVVRLEGKHEPLDAEQLERLGEHVAAWFAASPGGDLSDRALAAAWCEEIVREGLAERAITEEFTRLRALRSHCGKPLAGVLRADIVAFVARPGLNEISSRQYAASFRRFYLFLGDEGLRSDDPSASWRDLKPEVAALRASRPDSHPFAATGPGRSQQRGRRAGTLDSFADFDTPDGLVSDYRLVEMWLAEKQAAGHSSRTIREHLIMLRSFRIHLGKPLISAERSDLLSFLGRPDISKATRQSYGSTLRVFYTLLQDETYRIDNPAGRLPRIRVTPAEPDPLTTEQIERMLHSKIRAKTRLMILLGAYQGFRVAEIAAAHGQNVDWTERRILTAEAKGGKEVWRPIHSLVWAELKNLPRDEFFFPAQRDGRQHDTSPGHTSPKTVSATLSTTMRRVGITGHRPHQLRTWFATELINSGTDTMTAQFAMRHSSQATLQRYVKPSQERMRAAMESLPVVRLGG